MATSSGNITLTVNNQRVRDHMSHVLRVLENPQPLMLNVAEELVAQTQLVFEDEGYPAKSWESLRPSTIRQRTKKGYWPGKILQRVGLLASSIQASAGNNYAEAGTNLVYARIQHEGGKIARKGHIRLRTDKKGNLKRQKGYPNLAVFAKNSHKLAVARAVNYTITIPSRPYFPIQADGSLTPRAYDAVMRILSGPLLTN